MEQQGRDVMAQPDQKDMHERDMQLLAGGDTRKRLLAGLPIIERRLHLHGVSTAVLEGGSGPPLILLHGPGGYDRALAPSVQAAFHVLMRQFGLPAIPTADLAHIAVPASLIWGRHDRATLLSVAEATHAHFGWPLRVIEQCADDPPIEQPEACHLCCAPRPYP